MRTTSKNTHQQFEKTHNTQTHCTNGKKAHNNVNRSYHIVEIPTRNNNIYHSGDLDPEKGTEKSSKVPEVPGVPKVPSALL